MNSGFNGFYQSAIEQPLQPKWILFVVNQCAIPILIELHSQYRIYMNYLCVYFISFLKWIDRCASSAFTDWISECWWMFAGEWFKTENDILVLLTFLVHWSFAQMHGIQ